MRKSLWALVIFVAAGCSSDRESEVDRLFADYRPDGTPGASVMVIKDGAPILTRSYGLASVEDDIPVTPSTNFRLASVTKQFTATSILMLADQGKLSLDDSITKFFPDFSGVRERHNNSPYVAAYIGYRRL